MRGGACVNRRMVYGIETAYRLLTRATQRPATELSPSGERSCAENPGSSNQTPKKTGTDGHVLLGLI